MGLVNRQILGLGLGGVSQMPHELRDENQVSELSDAMLSWTRGLSARPATQEAVQVSASNSNFAQGFFHFFRTAEDARYLAVIKTNNTLVVHNADTGASQTLYSPHGLS